MNGFGERFLLGYLQSWGQSVDEKISLLNEAVALAGIEAKLHQNEEEGTFYWKAETEEEAARAANLKRDLETGWMLGNFQDEARRVISIIDGYASA